jgi:hypothetical protein
MTRNIQLYQTIILSCILFVWVYFFKLDISVFEIAITFVTVIFLDYLFINDFRLIKQNNIPYSGVNAAFWICFFLRSEDLILYIFAGTLAILWKHLIKIWWRHFLNPSNMAVFLTLCLFPQYAWINTLQWWNYSWNMSLKYIFMLGLVLSLWIFISTRVKDILKYEYLWNYIIPFVTLHSILFFIIPYYESFTSYFLFFNISFFIFVFFMITDPMTIPKKAISRSLYAVSMVLLFYVLQFFINENYALLWSLFGMTLFLPFIWKYEIINYKWLNIGFLGLVFLNILILIVIMFCLSIYWQPDLVFDNVCNQLVCK